MRSVLALGIIGLLAHGCGRESPPRQARASTTTVPRSAKLAPGQFRLGDLGRAADGSTRYLAEADGSPVPCQFEIVAGKATVPAGGSFSFGRASLARRAPSDCTSFLQTLAPLLGFKGALPTPSPSPRLEFSMAVLGTNLSRSTGRAEIAGGFLTNPPGTWLSSKLFLGDGEGEVFLNLNPTERVGELSIKDEDYATIVVTELGKVLLPERRGA